MNDVDELPEGEDVRAAACIMLRECLTDLSTLADVVDPAQRWLFDAAIKRIDERLAVLLDRPAAAPVVASPPKRTRGRPRNVDGMAREAIENATRLPGMSPDGNHKAAP